MSNGKKLKIVLAGQANVGKSVIFNFLTGLHQHIGNWPGKTVEKAEGTLYYRGHIIDALDLPGIYSLTTYSIEEIISRDYIALQKPDFVINVVDGLHLERNLIFTLQILELESPTVLALNFVNQFKEKGVEIDRRKLEEVLGVPVVPVAAISGKGLTKVLDRGMEIVQQKKKPEPLKYEEKVEEEIKKLIKVLEDGELPYPKRWLAIKLLEKDREIGKIIKEKLPKVLEETKKTISRLEDFYHQDSSVVIANERCLLASKIIEKTMKVIKPGKISFSEKLEAMTVDKILGYLVLILIFALVFGVIFKLGALFSSALEGLFSNIQVWYNGTFGQSMAAGVGWAGVENILGLVIIALPYIIPFYLILYFLEDWGYLARVAFLADSLMHKLGIHGKACIPLLLGYGCNVPACLSCRIMETQRERFITGFLTTFIPCSAVTVIILGLVGKFVGIGWAFGLYLLDLLIIFALGKLFSKILPGQSVELIMEMPDYRCPHLKTVILQTWFRLKEFLLIAAPLVVVSGIIIQGFYLAGWLTPISNFLSPITVRWLGLPAAVGILFIFGILRKELILVMLATLLGTANFAQVLTPAQMITLALVSMFYIPCVATISALWREFGWKKALEITIFKITFAIILGGLFFRLFKLVGV